MDDLPITRTPLQVKVPPRKNSVIVSNAGHTIRLTPEEVEPLIHMLFKAMDATGVDREQTGAMLSVIVKGALERLRDPKNAAKGGWMDQPLKAAEAKVFEEMSEFRQAALVAAYGGADRRKPEGRDVLAAMGMFLQLQEHHDGQ